MNRQPNRSAMNRWRHCLIDSARSRLVIGRLAMLQLILLLLFCTRVQSSFSGRGSNQGRKSRYCRRISSVAAIRFQWGE
ncbi:MAG: hypothetical protein E2O76_17090 [Caldithrix sp.]|nr:MAG: hypothetical protein E2O76_17090 [Caldithrix sp.]